MPTVKLQQLENNQQELTISNLILNEKKSINNIMKIIKLFHSNNIYIEFDGDFNPSVLGEELKKFEVNPIYIVSNVKDSYKIKYNTSGKTLEDVILLSIKNNYYIEIIGGDNLTWLQFLYYKLRENKLENIENYFNCDFKIVLNKLSGDHVITFKENLIDMKILNKIIELADWH